MWYEIKPSNTRHYKGPAYWDGVVKTRRAFLELITLIERVS